MYEAQHAAPKRRSTAGRHRQPAQTPQISDAFGALKPGPKIATGVSTFAVGAVGMVGMAAPAQADGQTLSFSQIASVVEDAGLPCVSGTAVAYAESGGDTDVNSQYPGEDSRGLFQINEAHGFDFDWDDPRGNARKAKEIYDSAGGWSPWGAYTNGSYAEYVDEAQAACADPSPVNGGTGGSGSSGGADLEQASYQGKHRKSEDSGSGADRDNGATYTVERGDTLSEIASARGTTWRHLAKMNSQIEDPASIFPGDKIDVSGHPVE